MATILIFFIQIARLASKFLPLFEEKKKKKMHSKEIQLFSYFAIKSDKLKKKKERKK